MATVKSLTSTPGLEGSLLRCQGHIGRSDRQRLRWRVGRRREKDTSEVGGGGGGGKCVHNVCVCACVCACARVCVCMCMHVRACERERDRESSAPWVGSGIPVDLDPYRYTIPRQPVSVHLVLPPRTTSPNYVHRFYWFKTHFSPLSSKHYQVIYIVPQKWYRVSKHIFPLFPVSITKLSTS